MALDPFGLWPSARSAIAGLGGGEPARTPKYTFASRQVTADGKRIAFALRFEGLQASSGVLRLRVGVQPERAKRSRWISDTRVPLADLAAGGGGWAVELPARSGALYALVGQVEGATDARAAKLKLQVRGAGGSGPARAKLLRARDRLLRHGRDRRSPTLAAPVSQMCTAAQMEEPVYARWLAELAMPAQQHRKQWEIVYILQVLESRGLIRPGARGLGFGSGAECFASYLARRGCDVLATDLADDAREAEGWRETGQHADGLDALYWPHLCSRETFDDRVRFRAVDMRAIPGDLARFDFCWSACAFEHLGSIRRGLAFVNDSLRPLRPGGVAVHTTEFNLTSNRRTVDHAGTVLFRRRDLERLGHRLRRQGHAVAPFTFDPGDRPLDTHVDVPPYSAAEHLRIALSGFVATSFGIVVTKDGARAQGAS